ncbi:MAG: ribonuclease HI [Anaerolineales bacterium]|nr:ribonuclease HI [Anaerolineales bacterium]
MTKQKVTIYSDGGADPNPGIGGWAALLRYGEHEKVLTGNDPHTTNNRMELQAAIAALSALNRACDIEFYTDSEYVRRGITEWIDGWAAAGWKRKGGKPIPNQELWQTLWTQVKKHEINWHWVKGHAGNRDNERVDQLARKARLAITPADTLFEDAIQVYVRASCKGNPGPGAWGVVIEDDGETEQHSGTEAKTTNNRMELVGVLEALAILPADRPVQITTSSDYVFQGATGWINGWRRRNWLKKDGQPISNQDLWQALDKQLTSRPIHWINGKGAKSDQPQGLQEASQVAVEALKLLTES